jgi:hypothetical protein
MVDWWPDEELTRADIDRATSGGECDVLLTHDAPAGFDVPDLPPRSTWEPAELHRAEFHRGLLREVVEVVRPWVLFHGHFHSRYDDQLCLPDGHTVSVTGLANEWTGADGFLAVRMSQLQARGGPGEAGSGS